MIPQILLFLMLSYGDYEPKVEKSPVVSNVVDNCVIFARSLNPNIPYNMFTINQKKAAADPEALPLPGNTVVIDVGTKAGHLAAIEEVHPSGEITVLDANWVPGEITKRTGTPDELGVVGIIPK